MSNPIDHIDLRGFLTFVAYASLFMAMLVGVLWWDRRKRRAERPFGEDVKLMRMPGEQLWRRVIEKDSTELERTLGLMVVPLIVGGFVFQLALYYSSKSVAGLVVALMVLVFVMLLCVRSLAASLQRRENEYLGYFGERFVADCLEPLKQQGWYIFHDVQFDGATGKFNLDHVAVGPGGLWLVETKTRRQGRFRPGLKRDEVTFDGVKIIWPWWDDTTSIRQAVRNADSLQKWLEKMAEKKFDVSVVVAIPGYKVKVTGKAGVRVAAPEDIRDVLIGHGNGNGNGKAVLSAEDIKAIRLPLAAKCGDVVY